MESIKGLKRTKYCGEVSVEDVSKEVTLTGWVDVRRDLGGIIFIDLRDRTGVVQVVFDEKSGEELLKKADRLRSEYCIGVRGIVEKRPLETVNPKLKTGEIEVRATELRIFSKSETPPFPVEEGINVNEATRLKYRYIDLRRPDMQRNIMFRHKLYQVVRNFLANNGFIEIETPMLTKSTPEGARDYLVPSRVFPGKFFALPQSPQIFKQLLMVSGFDRYFQIVKCFRDEDLRADRQPEFTQIDIEMSFVDVDDVIEINEKLIATMFKEMLGIDIKLPLPRLSYKEAMERFGSDKPDTRFGLELVDLTDIAKTCEFKVFNDAANKGGSVRAINAKGAAKAFSRREIDALVEFAKIYKAKGLAWIAVEEDGLKSPIVKFLKQEEIDSILSRLNAEVGDLLLFSADKNEIVFDVLGNLRLEVARKMNLIDDSKFNLLWVTDFPLFEYSEEEGRYVAKHHPFTSPREEDIELLETNPAEARAKAYDIVLNGTEIGGGSIRIHQQDVQKRMFKALGFSEEKAYERFGFLLDAFKYGTPPHGGIAYGFDRLCMLLLGLDSIRDTIAFPKVKDSSCPLTDAPSEVEPKQLRELHIKTDVIKL
ncbi:aspartate--tRNA ligase [Caldicellulosiruptoraceae bacterium PP1]